MGTQRASRAWLPLMPRTARSRDKKWDFQPRSGNRPDSLPRIRSFEEMSQFLHILRKCFGVGFQIPSQRTGGEPVGSRSAPQSEVDAPRIECLYLPKLLSHANHRIFTH